jgi:hypothetical protein
VSAAIDPASSATVPGTSKTSVLIPAEVAEAA